MKIKNILEKKRTLSFEIFPPKKDSANIESIYKTIDELSELNPDFISVTYGAMGSTTKRTLEIAKYIKNVKHVEALAHLTGINTPHDDVLKMCNEFKMENIENIMSLRGDYPVGFNGTPIFKYASELNEFIQKYYNDDFCLGGGCYPEAHLECENLFDDLKNLKKKQDSGASFFITQVFFDNNYFYRFVREARNIGITVPILAGIMPITSVKQIRKMSTMCGANVPVSLISMLEKYRDDEKAMREIGIAYATNQIIDLLANDVDGIHIYTMNKPENAKQIVDAIKNVLKDSTNER
ncbi:MAG: methylenetetrahydrofolate reductase [NAD(P)H] [Acholeplasmatales bacterium]|nr:methylenetetrahydrofolate reductase [NAD(P)H] [Acholeplasmatales bacterium]